MIPQGKEMEIVRTEGILAFCLEAPSRSQSREGAPSSGCVAVMEMGVQRGSWKLQDRVLVEREAGRKAALKKLCPGMPLSLY